MECYVATKEAIASNQTVEDTCVLNYEDAYTRDFGSRCPAKVVYFSSRTKLEEGVYLDGEEIILAKNGEKKPLMNIHDMNLVGMCNVENVMAAIVISMAMEVPMNIILDTIHVFKAVEHRIEFVATKNGVDYYNDSKGTNVDAAVIAAEGAAALHLLQQPLAGQVVDRLADGPPAHAVVVRKLLLGLNFCPRVQRLYLHPQVLFDLMIKGNPRYFLHLFSSLRRHDLSK